ncbi:ribbon-helix-helix domain-containing protein [Desulforamulus ferrireducens]|uniref:ribbon-helix-helix domain-containing protein n=1 Tax=Desulforamulus ferrireducens TaxID=1833852 RepID=UPI00098AB1E4|nr:ribbon-helix-helix domain-containing protein [Desulforamulus ferrireducens]
MSQQNITVTLPTRLVEILESEAARQNKDLSETIREIVIFYLNQKSLEQNINRSVFAMD